LGILKLKIELHPFNSVNEPSHEMRELDPCDYKQRVDVRGVIYWLTDSHLAR
jgi:hypothetical protein